MSSITCSTGMAKSSARRTASKHPPKPSPALSSQDAALLRRLDVALSEDELRRILASALRALSDAARTDVRRQSAQARDVMRELLRLQVADALAKPFTPAPPRAPAEAE